MGISGGPDMIQDGLVLSLDAADRNSYVGSGTSWRDLSGNNNNGTLTNGPTFNSANGGSIVFNGSNTNSTSNSTTFNLTAGVSIGVFFKSTDITSRQQGIITYQLGTLGNPYINFWCPGTGFLRWETFTSTSPNIGGSLLSSTSLANNTWYYAVGTYNNGVSNLYLNGTLSTTSTYSATNYPSYNAPVIIGEYSSFGNLSGNVAQVSIHNRALTATEILQNYNSQKSRFGLR